MRDWNQFVSERLKSLRVSQTRRREIIEELAAHYSEMHAADLAKGMSEFDSIKLIENSTIDWNLLSKNIQRAEHDMTHRIKSVLIPGTITLLLFSLCSAVLYWMNVRPAVFMSAQGVPFIFDTHLVFFFPLIGAIGAYLSRKSDGTVKECLMAGTFPAVVMFVSLCVILAWGVVIDHVAITHNISRMFWAVLVCFTYVVFLPALLLLIGAAPAALFGRDKSTEMPKLI